MLLTRYAGYATDIITLLRASMLRLYRLMARGASRHYITHRE